MENTSGLQLDDFVKTVKQDANASNGPIIFLTGYLGESPVEGHVRVYFDEGLNQFSDVPKSAIAHSEKITQEENPLGGSKLWVKQNAMAASSIPSSQTAQENFLQGDLYQQYANTMYSPAFNVNNPPATVHCPTNTGQACAQITHPLPTQKAPCSINYACGGEAFPSEIRPHCPDITWTCPPPNYTRNFFQCRLPQNEKANYYPYPLPITRTYYGCHFNTPACPR